MHRRRAEQRDACDANIVGPIDAGSTESTRVREQQRHHQPADHAQDEQRVAVLVLSPCRRFGRDARAGGRARTRPRAITSSPNSVLRSARRAAYTGARQERRERESREHALRGSSRPCPPSARRKPQKIAACIGPGDRIAEDLLLEDPDLTAGSRARRGMSFQRASSRRAHAAARRTRRCTLYEKKPSAAATTIVNTTLEADIMRPSWPPSPPPSAPEGPRARRRRCRSPRP